MSDLSDARAELAALQSAYLTAAATGITSYSIAGRTVTRASLRDIRDAISHVRHRIALMETGGVSYGAFTGQQHRSESE